MPQGRERKVLLGALLGAPDTTHWIFGNPFSNDSR